MMQLLVPTVAFCVFAVPAMAQQTAFDIYCLIPDPEPNQVSERTYSIDMHNLRYCPRFADGCGQIDSFTIEDGSRVILQDYQDGGFHLETVFDLDADVLTETLRWGEDLPSATWHCERRPYTSIVPRPPAPQGPNPICAFFRPDELPPSLSALCP